MKKRIPWYVAVLIVVVVIAICGFIYTRLPIVPTAPPQPKGSNRPPAGLRAHKNATVKAAQSKKAANAEPDQKEADSKKTAPDGKTDGTAPKKSE